jgi:hypothetical protein
MVGYMSLREQVDKDLRLARRKASLGRIGARLRTDDASNLLPRFPMISGRSPRRRPWEDPSWPEDGGGGTDRGRRRQMFLEFDGDFMPAKASVEGRCKRVDGAFHLGEELPPVSLYEAGGSYFVLDGHHRVWVARYHRVEWIDAYVTEFGAATGGGVWSERRDTVSARSSHPKRTRRGT